MMARECRDGERVRICERVPLFLSLLALAPRVALSTHGPRSERLYVCLSLRFQQVGHPRNTVSVINFLVFTACHYCELFYEKVDSCSGKMVYGITICKI